MHAVRRVPALSAILWVLVSCTTVPGLAPTEAPVWQAGPPTTAPPPAPHATVIVDEVISDPGVIGLMAELQRRGIGPRPSDESQVGWLRHARGQSYQLGERNDREKLYVHPYRSVEEALENAADIPQDGDNGIIDWVDIPHFFRCEHVIVLYLGRDSRVLSALAGLCGPQFAGRE